MVTGIVFFVFRGYRHHYVRRYSKYDILPLQAQNKAIPDSLQRLEEEQVLKSSPSHPGRDELNFVTTRPPSMDWPPAKEKQ